MFHAKIETTISSQKMEVKISRDLPLVIIGERINPTGKKKLAEALRNKDFDYLREEALKQVEAGAQILDINVGVPGMNEAELLKEAIEAISDVTDVPLCIDSSNINALREGLEVYKGKALINSVNGEEEKLNELLPIIKKKGAAVIGLTMDNTGIPNDPQKRFEIAKKIVERAEDYGIMRENVIIDCITMPVSADYKAGEITLETMKLVYENLRVNMTLGVSNVSFGLPKRDVLNNVLTCIASAIGLSCVITDPTIEEVKKNIAAINLIYGKDVYCRNYLKTIRAKN